MTELTYQKDGHDVKTSQFLRNRGTCCKTSCLHCPYGFTLKKEGLKFLPVTEGNFAQASKLAPDESATQNSVAASFLASAFGEAKPKTFISKENMSDFLLVTLKDEVCALVKKSGLQATEVFYAKHFDKQGIDLDSINGALI
ncbi:MAG: hypothetical protein ACJAT2_002198 [Bacteriovoracaceae bacterium]|jgi:hypothetical protein